MRTTIDLPDPLFKKLKARVAMDGVKLREFIAGALETALKPAATPEGARKFKPLPVIKRKGKPGPLMAKLNNDVIAELELQDDIERYRKSLGR
jgi:hypothetical protein